MSLRFLLGIGAWYALMLLIGLALGHLIFQLSKGGL